jgi:hypothetical protein
MYANLNAYNNLIGKSEGRRLLGRPKHRRENNIEINLSVASKSILT